MNHQDLTLTCQECSKPFTYTAQEQEIYERRGIEPPIHCLDCYKQHKVSRKQPQIALKDYLAQTPTPPLEQPAPTQHRPAQPSQRPAQPRPAMAAKPTPSDTGPGRSRDRRKQEQPNREQMAPKPTQPIATAAAVTPIASGAGFTDFKLDERLHRAVREAGYETPTPIQIRAIPIGLAGRDLIGTAQTGTGKTAAFVLPILQSLLTKPVKEHRTRVLVLTPTRELAEQVKGCFVEMAKHTKIRCATVYGGVGMDPQARALREGAEVIVACPGRLLDHIERGNARLYYVEHLVLDEADRMLDMGFMPSVKRILEYLPKERQTMLFSATIGPEIARLAKGALKNPEQIAVDICAPAKTVAHALYPCQQHLKTSLLLRVLSETDTKSVLIFTRTRHRANRVAWQLGQAGYVVAALHSDKSQGQRQGALDAFRAGRCQILVATDIAARGLDIADISHVINYDIPASADAYIHRIGRTGRAEKEGDAFTLVTDEDRQVVKDIEKVLGATIDRVMLDNFNYNEPRPTTAAAQRRKEENITSRPWSQADINPNAPPPPGGKRPGNFITRRKLQFEASSR